MRKMILIEGMSCNHCTGRVQGALGAIDGVNVDSTSVDEKNVIVTLDKDIDDSIIRSTVSNAGYNVIGIREI